MDELRHEGRKHGRVTLLLSLTARRQPPHKLNTLERQRALGQSMLDGDLPFDDLLKTLTIH